MMMPGCKVRVFLLNSSAVMSSAYVNAILCANGSS